MQLSSNNFIATAFLAEDTWSRDLFLCPFLLTIKVVISAWGPHKGRLLKSQCRGRHPQLRLSLECVSLWQPIWCALIRNIAAAGMSLTEELVLKRSKARSLEAVRNLNCWGCGLSDVSILARIPNLEVLNIRWVWHYICIHILQYWYNFYGHFNISVATTWQAWRTLDPVSLIYLKYLLKISPIFIQWNYMHM